MCGETHERIANNSKKRFCSTCRAKRDNAIKNKYRAKKPRLDRKTTIWNAERIEIVRAGRLEGLSSQAIADQLGVTRNAVIGIANRENIPTLTKSVKTREEKLARWRAYRREYTRRYRAANPDKVKHWERKARKKNLLTGPKPKDWKPLPSTLPKHDCCLSIPYELNTGCMWMPGEADDRLCCGQPRRKESAWCEHHHGLVYA